VIDITDGGPAKNFGLGLHYRALAEAVISRWFGWGDRSSTSNETLKRSRHRIRTEQIRQGVALIPLPMEPPLAARREQSVGHEHEQHLIQRVPLGLGKSRSAKNSPNRNSCHSQSANQHAPHCRHNRNSLSRSRTTAPSGTSPSQRSSGNSASVRGTFAPSSNTSIDRRDPNSCEALISPR
jgi:hypothetical protein